MMYPLVKQIIFKTGIHMHKAMPQRPYQLIPGLMQNGMSSFGGLLRVN